LFHISVGDTSQSGSHNLLSTLPGGGSGAALVSTPGPSLLGLLGVDIFDKLVDLARSQPPRWFEIFKAWRGGQKRISVLAKRDGKREGIRERNAERGEKWGHY
jgi:hypothetical protein